MTTSRAVPQRRCRRLAAVIASVLAVSLAACGGSEPRELAGYTLDPAPYVGDLALPDAATDDQAMPLRADPDGVLLTFFGFTNCPDICPLTMSKIRRVLGDLDDQADRVRVAMVTVDPDRDTDDVLTSYVRGFVPEGHALRTTDPAELRAVADRFGVSYIVTTTPSGTVEVSHTGSVFVVDDTGTVRLVWTFGTPADDMAADLSSLLDHLAST